MADKSAFMAWFVAQFGKREHMDGTFEELEERVLAGRLADMELSDREKWDSRQYAARKAWNAREKESGA